VLCFFMLGLAGCQLLGLLVASCYCGALEKAWLSHYKGTYEHRLDTLEQPLVSPALERCAIDAFGPSAQSWEVLPAEVVFGRKLGEGYFGEVFLASWRHQEVVVKRLKHGVRGEGADAEEANFRRELAMLVELRHPRVVQFIGACTQPQSRFICLEFLAGGSLHDQIHSDLPSPSFAARLRMLMDVVSGMCYLHGASPPIIHRDLTTNNILLDEHGRCKVADFGLSRVTAKRMSALPGNMYYCAPEILEEYDEYTKLVDVYSFAICTWELFSRLQPFQELTPQQLLRQVPDGLRPDIQDAKTPVSMKKLISACWAEHPKNRPDFTQVIRALADIKSGQVPPKDYIYLNRP